MESDFLKTAAQNYWTLGLPVVPLKGKRPLVEWTKWQTHKQTLKDFEVLPWDKADGFAVICGTQTKDGLFIGAIDFAVKNLPQDVIEKGRNTLRNLPSTQIEETPSGGQHWIYLSQQKPKTISLYHNICGLELIGEGKLCIMAPSQGYKRLNDTKPSAVDSLEQVFFEALRKAGIAAEEKKTLSFSEFEIVNKIAEKTEEIDRKVRELVTDPKILLKILETTDFKIKDDYATKLSVFFTALSAYTPEPLNLFIRGHSSTGKSYNAVEILKLFPEKDIWHLGGLSPTALIHQHGELMDENGTPLGDPPLRSNFEDKNEYRRAMQDWIRRAQSGYVEVDLTGKILLFLESPNIHTFNMLRPILSHDTYKISYRITDKTDRGRLKTKHTVIKGFPATIFLNAKDQFLEELATRSFTVSPVEQPHKYKKANRLTNTLNCFPWLKDEYGERTFIIKKAIEKIKEKLQKTEVVNAFYGLNEYYPASIPRDMRDYQHLEQFLKCITALHVFNRPIMQVKDKRYIVMCQEDVKVGFAIFNMIFETTRTGVSQHLSDFYHKVVKQKEQWDSTEIIQAYNLHFKPKRSRKTIYKYLTVLGEIGYVDVEPSETDKRKNIYRPLVKEDEEELVSFRLISEKNQLDSFSLKKEFENWLEKLSPQIKFYIYNFENGEEREIQWDELENIVLQNRHVVDNLLTLLLASKTENKTENIRSAEEGTKETNFNRLVRINGKLYPTEKCAKCGGQPVE